MTWPGRWKRPRCRSEIIKAHGKTKAAQRAATEGNEHVQLGLLPNLEATVEEVEAANARAKKGVKIDRRRRSGSTRARARPGSRSWRRRRSRSRRRWASLSTTARRDGASGEREQEPIEAQSEEKPSRSRSRLRGITKAGEPCQREASDGASRPTADAGAGRTPRRGRA